MFSLSRVLTSALLKDDENGEHIILLMDWSLKYYYAMVEFLKIPFKIEIHSCDFMINKFENNL